VFGYYFVHCKYEGADTPPLACSHDISYSNERASSITKWECRLKVFIFIGLRIMILAKPYWESTKHAKMTPCGIDLGELVSVNLAGSASRREVPATFSGDFTKPNAGLQLASLGRLTVFASLSTTESSSGMDR
jgi:hypothetical protein